jgi:hypothetical protein
MAFPPETDHGGLFIVRPVEASKLGWGYSSDPRDIDAKFPLSSPPMISP